MGAARGEPSGGAIPMRGAAEPRLLSALRIGGLSENTAENGNRYFRKSRLDGALHYTAEAFSGRLIQRMNLYMEKKIRVTKSGGESDESSCANRQTR